MKNKNDPYDLKCKINPKIFFRLRGSQKGGGGPPFGKNSQKIPFFFWQSHLNTSAKQFEVDINFYFLGQAGAPSATQTIKVNMATSSKFSSNSAPKAVAAALGTTLPKQFGKGTNV